MRDVLVLGGALGAGLLLGGMFFGGLWWTVRKGVASSRPAVWFVGSLLLRTGILLAGFYFVGVYRVSTGSWSRLLLCLLGFTLARLVVTWWTRSLEQPQSRQGQEASHASQPR